LRQFGLIGYPLSHSFSQGYFTEKFLHENEKGLQYTNFPIASIDDFNNLWVKEANLQGLNVTIPYKKAVIPFLHHTSSVVKKINACNCIRKYNNELYGFNTDVIGFEKSLAPFLQTHHTHALILGTGGAAVAVEWVLQKLNINYLLVSRANAIQYSSDADNLISYNALTTDLISQYTLIINTSPLGMYPNVDDLPSLPYEAITAQHHLYDLIYNPAETLFMKKGLAQGATVQNGLNMLHIQAEESWRIWNTLTPLLEDKN
jgi:shikimate dehydrogenase